MAAGSAAMRRPALVVSPNTVRAPNLRIFDHGGSTRQAAHERHAALLVAEEGGGTPAMTRRSWLLERVQSLCSFA